MSASTDSYGFSRRTKNFLTLFVVVGLIVMACSAVAAKAATSEAIPTVSGYVTSPPCVPVNSSAIIAFTTTNSTNVTRTVIIEPNGVVTQGDADPNKGPYVVADTTTSGLVQTARLPIWHWVFKIHPGETIVHALFVTNTGSPYFAYVGVPRLWAGGVWYVRNTTKVIYSDDSPAYCGLPAAPGSIGGMK